MRDYKEYEDSPTLDPKAQSERAEYESYMFYPHLSWDAPHLSKRQIVTTNRRTPTVCGALTWIPSSGTDM